MGKFEINQVDVKNDGRIILYQRPRPDGSIIPTWQMRISVPNSTGYHRASTGEKEQSEAIRKATNTYEELYMKVMSGGHLNPKSFKDCYEEWEIVFPRKSSGKNKEYIDGHIRRIRIFALKFFGGFKLEDITRDDLE